MVTTPNKIKQHKQVFFFSPQKWKVNSDFKPLSEDKSQKSDSEVTLKGEPEAPTGDIMNTVPFHSSTVQIVFSFMSKRDFSPRAQ